MTASDRLGRGLAAGLVTGTAWLMTAPAVLLAAWLLAGVPLLLAGAFRPAWAVPAAAALALPMLLVARRVRAPALPWWAALLTLVVVGCATGWAVAHASENLVVRRDPGPYGLIAHWIGVHGTMRIPDDAAVFGHDPALSYDSPGFYSGPGDSVQPQFQSGPALAFAPGAWVAGLHGGLAANAVIAGLAVLAAAGLAARVIGPCWAPLAALVLAVAYPQTHTARSPYSETVDELLLLGGLAMLVAALSCAGDGRDGVDGDRVPIGPLAIAGLVLGAAPLARVDAFVDLMPLAVVIVLLAALPGRRPLRRAGALAAGLAAGIGLALADDHWLHYLYVHDIPASLDPLWIGGAVLAALTMVAAVAVRRPAVRARLARVPRQLLHRVAAAAAAAVCLVAAGLWFVRPYVSHPLTWPTDPAIPEIAELQRFQHLPVDGRRTYAEWSLHWLGWWLGPVTVVLAVAALAALVRRHVRGRDLALVPLTVVTLCAAVVVLYDPKAAGDHPWVERRFVPVVLPAVVLLATAALAWLARRAPRGRLVAAVGAVAVLAPTVVASASLWGSRTETGQYAAVRTLCARAGPGAAVVMVDDPVGLRLAQTVRDLCGVPVARLRRGTVAGAVDRLARPVAATGRHLVLMGWERSALGAYAGRAEQVVGLTYPSDQRLLMKRPSTVGHEDLQVWLVDLG
ncbi:MAG: hypothetical protein ACJ74O_14690 [Frankiaceae bacterium]